MPSRTVSAAGKDRIRGLKEEERAVDSEEKEGKETEEKDKEKADTRFGKWFAEGANYTLDTFANASLGAVKKGEKGRWSFA